MYIAPSLLGNITFGIFCAVILGMFGYYLRLQGRVAGKVIAEFESGLGETVYIICNKKREMLIDQSGKEIKAVDENGKEISIAEAEKKYESQLVVEIEVPNKERKLHPELGQTVYYTRRDCVTTIRYPVGSPLPITVGGKKCHWAMGCSEPVSVNREHRELPITSSAAFAAGIREHDLLMNMGMMVDSMQNFMQDTAQKMAAFAKNKNNTMMIILIVLAILASLGAVGAAMVVLNKLSSAGF